MTIYLIEHFVLDRWIPLKEQETCFSKTRSKRQLQSLLESHAVRPDRDENDNVKLNTVATIRAMIAVEQYRIAEYKSTGAGLRLMLDTTQKEESHETNTLEPH